MNDLLTVVEIDPAVALYRFTAPKSPKVQCFVASAPETRAICNDPFVTGVRYTRSLSTACARIIKLLSEKKLISLRERDTTVLHVLRGGISFGLREALADAFGWNDHASAFISAQRAKRSPGSDDWVITESAYKKIHLRARNNVVFGDVVATGTSLEYALARVAEEAVQSNVSIETMVFFTIGSPRAHEILSLLNFELSQLFPSYLGAAVIYLEGIFPVATMHSPLTLKIDGTDLLRREWIAAPEFIESQYQLPSSPLERCVVYDAGARAFNTAEYFEDVRDYWSHNLELARKGVAFQSLLNERCPGLDSSRYGDVSLQSVCERQLEKMPSSESLAT